MKALTYRSAHNVAVETVPDPVLEADDDIILRVTATAIWSSDLHIFRGKIPGMEAGDILGHEFMGIVEETGRGVTQLKRGDRVVVPFTIACGECFFCNRSLFAACETTNSGRGAILNKKNVRPGAGLFGYSHLYGGYQLLQEQQGMGQAALHGHNDRAGPARRGRTACSCVARPAPSPIALAFLRFRGRHRPRRRSLRAAPIVRGSGVLRIGARQPAVRTAAGWSVLAGARLGGTVLAAQWLGAASRVDARTRGALGLGRGISCSRSDRSLWISGGRLLWSCEGCHKNQR